MPDLFLVPAWNYTHIATVKIRRLHLTWSETEVADYEKLATLSRKAEVELPDFVKAILRKHVEPRSKRS